MRTPPRPPAARPLQVGRRVVVRHLIEEGARATDALGDLVAADAVALTVRTSRGDVTIARSQIVVAKEIAPTTRPWRLASFLRRAGVAVLDLDGVVRTCDAPVPATVELVKELRARAIPVFVFTNGTDREPAELEQIGLGHLLPGVLHIAELGRARPDPEAYAAAHAEIERRLGRRVGTAEVRFTDGSVPNVEAARAFGWQAQVFTLPG